ncbi:hypothetical protein P3T36_003332 [Kitasatospora sp. MAP12-15]|uniref:hypothetical protein n=1 Tax=unclassified Kitasatospora TaxID=2633591 RepID=UPI00247698D5|nr:hypothetical protein [Kitasatospora sp. MAP12-44]MDH6111308.1 hypothetical protein [Kitasatospora sp. MAP12-44]
MPNSQFGQGDGAIVRRRMLIGLGVLLVVALLAGLVARLAGGGHTGHPAASASPASSPTAVSSPSAPSTSAAPSDAAVPSVPRPPHTTSPTDFAKAFATVLWSYDTRHLTQAQQVNGLRLWLTPESKYADPASVEGQVPDPVLWSRMADNGQYATGTVAEAHLPASFQAAIAQNPSALMTAYIYAVTVTGSQAITWNGGGNGAEDRAITVAVQCRPSQDCALAAIAPTVYL